MGNKKLVDRNNSKLQHKEERTVIDSKQLKRQVVVTNLTQIQILLMKRCIKCLNILREKEFEQFEKG